MPVKENEISVAAFQILIFSGKIIKEIIDFFIILLKLKVQMGGCYDKIDAQIPTQLDPKQLEIKPSKD